MQASSSIDIERALSDPKAVFSTSRCHRKDRQRATRSHGGLERHADQIRHAPGLQLGHDFPAVNFDAPTADSERSCKSRCTFAGDNSV